MKGKLIAFEGIECSGKSKQTELLADYLRQQGIEARLMHEPGGTLYGECLRAILKYPAKALNAILREFDGHSDFPNFGQLAATGEFRKLDVSRTPECELFLFEAARAEYAKTLKPILESGVHVISDRYFDSTTAYQGGGRGLDMADIDFMNDIAINGIWPNLTFLLDIPIEVMLERVSRQNNEKKSAYFEQTETREFFQRVRIAYLAIAEDERSRIVVLDGTESIPKVFDRIAVHVNLLLGIS